MSEKRDQSGILSKLKKTVAALKEMRAELEAEKAAKKEPVAVIGMSCRLPGADDLSSYWNLLSKGLDGTREIPEDRWSLKDYYDPDPDAPGKMYCRRGGFLSDIDGMDPAFFGVSPREALSLDPQQRLLLEVSWEAIENAGIAADYLRDTSSGVFIGLCGQDYGRHTVFSGIPERIDPYCLTGAIFSAAAGRISHVLGLRGPALAIDTACSSSLTSIHLAIGSLRQRECELALAGGVNIMTVPETTVYFCKLKALSPGGRCKSFDADADGYARGEGCGMIVLKRLSDALRDNDNILAVIKGSAINHDGKSGGLTVPNGPSQADVMRKALKDANTRPDQVDYIEAHGTATPLGDPIEIGALGEVYKKHCSPDNPLIIGSAKTNIGHLEGGAGVAGTIKVILALNKKIIPPHINFKRLNSKISRHDFAFHIPTEAVSWTKENGRRVAGVSSFGISGTNAHLIIEEAPEKNIEDSPPDNEPAILALSAKSDKALDDLIERYRDLLKNSTSSLGNIARAANTGRNQMKDRVAVLLKDASDIDDLFSRIKNQTPSSKVFRGKKDYGKNKRVVFLFTGQGSQYFKMGFGLYNSQKTFRDALDKCNEIYLSQNDHSLLDVLFSEKDAQLINQTLYTQPSLFALQYSLAELWKSWGVKPNIVMGHSVGEIAASAIAGVFSMEEGLLFAMKRARVMNSVSHSGSMAAVFSDLSAIEEIIEDYSDKVAVAAVNAEQSVVISGDETAMAEIAEALEKQNIRYQPLAVSHAFHSPLMDPILADIRNIAEDINFKTPQIRLIANLTGKTLGNKEMSAVYWAEHARNSVKFHESIKSAEELGGDIFVEIGPSPVLLSLARQTLASPEKIWLPSLTKGKDDNEQTLASLSQAFVNGVDINWKNFYPQKKYCSTELPNYPFQRESYWIESVSHGFPSSKENDLSERSEEQRHSLLGVKLSTAGDEIIFSNKIGADNPEFLNDHKVYNKTVFPAAGYWEMALAACSKAFDMAFPVISDVLLAEPLIIDDGENLTLQLVIGKPSGGQADFTISSRVAGQAEKESWRRHASGSLVLKDDGKKKLAAKTLSDLKSTCRKMVDSQQFMSKLRSMGLRYGPAFQTVDQIFTDGAKNVIAKVGLSPETASSDSNHVFHPTMMDGCMQAMAAALTDKGADSPYLPIAIDKIAMYGPVPDYIWRHSEIMTPSAKKTDGVIKGNIRVYDDNGALLADFIGVHALRVPKGDLLKAIGPLNYEDWLYEIKWVKKETPKKIDPLRGTFVIFSDKSGYASRLKELLQENQRASVIVESGSEYSKTDDETYIVNPNSEADFKRLFQDILATRDGEISGHAYLWGLDAAPADNATTEELTREQNNICGGLLNLTQALLSFRLEKSRLWIATQGAQDVDSTRVHSPIQSLLWGFARVINNELASLETKLIDLDFISVNNAADNLYAELGISDAENQVAWRNENRFVCRLAGKSASDQSKKKSKQNSDSHQSPTPDSDQKPIQPNASYLITGGTGGLGLAVARRLADMGATNLILTARRQPPKETMKQIDEIEGAEIKLIFSDISDESQTQALFREIEESFPPLRGVVHAAGVLDDGVIGAQTMERFQKVLSPKVAGAWNLHNASLDLKLDFFVLFSSVSAIFGAPGQSSYAAGNSYPDALTAYRNRLGLPGVSVGWGAWSGAGMAGNVEDGKQLWKRLGLETIDPEEGLDILANILSTPRGNLSVIKADWDIFFQNAPNHMATKLFNDFKTVRASVESAEKAPAVDSPFPARLRDIPINRRPQYLIELIKTHASRILGIASPESMDSQVSLYDIGLDSLMALELRNNLETALGRLFPSTLLFEHPTPEKLAEYLLDEIITSEAKIDEVKSDKTISITRYEDQAAKLSDDELERALLKELEEIGF